MDDLNFWGTAGSDEPMSMGEEYDDELMAGQLMVEEHRTQDVPTLTALFTRTFPTYTETMWVHGYVGARVIVISYPGIAMPGDRRPIPGLIRSIPVGWRDMASAETFRAKFEMTAQSLADTGGWSRKSHAVGTH